MTPDLNDSYSQDSIPLLHQQIQILQEQLEKIKEEENDYEDFFENSIVPLNWVSPNGIILKANRAELNLMGYSLEEYVGHHIAEFHVDQFIIMDILTKLTNGQPIQNYQAELRCKDGSIKQVLISSNVLWRNGKFIHTRSFNRDITDRVTAENLITSQHKLMSKRHEEKFKILVESVKDYAIFMLDKEGNVTSWNEGAKSFIGYESYEIIGRHFSTFYPENEKYTKPKMELKTALQEGRFEDEGWRIRKDGSQFWSNVIITPMKDSHGELIGYSKVTRDLSERKKAEDKLKESQIFLDSVVENLPNMIFVKDAQNLKFIRFNKAGEELLGFSREELIGKNDFDFFPKEEADHFVSNDRDTLNHGIILDIPEESIQTKYKGSRTLHTRKIPILDANGKAQYLLGISEDITDWKKTQIERLNFIREQAANVERKKENERIAFLANISIMLSSSLDYRKSLNQLAQAILPALADWCTITIVKEDRSKERIVIDHHDPLKKELIAELSKNYPAQNSDENGVGYVIHTGKPLFTPYVNDSELVTGARDQRHLEIMRKLECYSCIIVPILVGDKVLGAISFVSSHKSRIYTDNDLGIAEEIGRRTGIAIDNAFHFEAAQQAIKARDEFMSIASHELKTPLTSMKLQSQMRIREIKRGNFQKFEQDKVAELISNDDKQLNKLVRLVDDMLDISRMRTGKLTLTFEAVDLNELIKEVISRFKPQFEEIGSVVIFETNETVIGKWDRFRMEQVFINMLTNAMKYGKGKPVRINLTSDDYWAHISIIDQGIGIAKKDHDRIFEQFERAISPNSISGLGMGLYITRKILEAHNGIIRVGSELGKGSTFYIDVPLDFN